MSRPRPSSSLLALIFALTLFLPASPAAAVEVIAEIPCDPGTIELASTNSDGSKAAGSGTLVSATSGRSISADGRRVAFSSSGTNLPGAGTASGHVYVKDLDSAALTLASTTSAGTPGNGQSFRPALSADGGTVAFGSFATNLHPADTDSGQDSYATRLSDGQVFLVNSTAAGVKGNSGSFEVSISGDGNLVSFSTGSSNLDPADTSSDSDVYVKNLATGAVSLVSATTAGVRGNGADYRGGISADGNYVAFWSRSTNLSPDDTDTEADVYLKNLTTGELTLVSRDSDGNKLATTGFVVDGAIPSISADGTRVAFLTPAAGVPADTNALIDAYVKDVSSGALILASTSANGELADEEIHRALISGDGASVAFSTFANTLHPAAFSHDGQVFVKDLASGDLYLASRSATGVSGNGTEEEPAINHDGTKVAFWSLSANLHPDDGDSASDVLVKTLGCDDADTADPVPGPIDDFNDGLDPATWNTSQATDGMRWCNPTELWHNLASEACSGVTQSGPYGTITEAAGAVSFAADGTERSFPYIWTNDGVIPATGDFVVEVRLRYDALSNHGSGLLLRPWADPTPSGNNPPAEYQEFGATPSGGCANWSVWADSAGGLRTHLAGQAAPVDSASAYHDYVIEYVDGKYLLFVDGTLVLGPVETTLRADRLWMGNPTITDWGLANWSDFTVDHVLVSQPTVIDGDGDGIHDGDETFAPTGVPAHSDLDSDGLPDFCDPEVAPTDTDGDGHADDVDNCPSDANPDQADADTDGIGDACDTATDTDGDGVDDGVDNCVGEANTDQADFDGDGLGDACDEDIDGDGLTNIIEIWLGCDPYDPDSDDDGVWDGVELVVGTNVLLADSNPDDTDSSDGGWLLRIVWEACGCTHIGLTDDENGNGVFDVVEWFYFGGLYVSGSHGGGGFGTLIEYIWHLCGCGPDDDDGNGIPQAVDHHWGGGGLLRYIVHCGCTPWDDTTGGGGGLRIEFLNLLTGGLDEDPDGDGVLTIIELLIGCDPHSDDSDGDGLGDHDEIFVYGTDVLNPDTDGDGMLDGIEIELGCDPLDPDSDDDGKPDGSDPAPLLFVSACDPANIDPVRLGEAINFTFGLSGSVVSGAVNWGDGTTPEAANSAGSHSLSHTYGQAGVYTVTCTGTDTTGGSESTTYQYVVVYDPNGGFVTGGGWIDSPAGAYTPDPSLAGKATFGFVSKYQKGASVPTGQTEFQFRVADLNFHSKAYEWLVIAGARAQYKGTGTINGAGNYGFLLTAIDGQVSGGGGVDRFRMKIWDRDNGDVVVYDNQVGDGDDAAPSMTLGGGSIVIHAKK